MDAVIPPEVLAHLQEIQEERTSTEGLFTARDLADAMGESMDEAKRCLRGWMREGRVRPKRIRMTDQVAWELGYLGGGSVLGYVWVDAA